MIVVFEKLCYCNTPQKSQSEFFNNWDMKGQPPNELLLLLTCHSSHGARRIKIRSAVFSSHSEFIEERKPLYAAYSDTCLFIPHDKTILRGMNANSAQSLIQGLFVLFPSCLKKYGWKQIMWSLQTGEISKILSTTETLTSSVCNYFHLQSLWRAGIVFNFFFSPNWAYPKPSLTQSIQSLLRSLRRLETVSIHIQGSQKKTNALCKYHSLASSSIQIHPQLTRKTEYTKPKQR